MSRKTESGQLRRPRLALAIASGLGLGYLPKAPGTWGALLGASLAWVFFAVGSPSSAVYLQTHALDAWRAGVLLSLILGLGGVYVADQAARYLGSDDPPIVVIDEVSGQFMTLLLGGRVTGIWPTGHERFEANPSPLFGHGPLNWKYFAVGFILFRVFDIWKPFPVRQAERLPGGWGIMADDWGAAAYAALGLWAAKLLGL